MPHSIRLLQKLSLLAILLLCLVQVACTKQKSLPKPCPIPSQMKGFSYSPFGFPLDVTKVPQFLAEVVGLKDSGIVWNGPWRDDFLLGTDAGSIPATATLVLDAAQRICFVPVTVFSWRAGAVLYLTDPDNPTNDWSNAESIAHFQSMLVEFANTYHPPYMLLGSDNDFYYEMDAADYANWLTAYNSFYDAIKAVSPGTSVGPVFSNEHISGQGTHVGWNMTYWDAIDDHDFDKVDIVGVSVYPFYHYADAADVPTTHLDDFLDHVDDKPILITETGWPAEDQGGLSPDWNVGEDQQEDYIPKLFNMISGKEVPAVNWLFLNTMVDEGSASDYWKTFGTVSLRDDDGDERPAYELWTAQ